MLNASLLLISIVTIILLKNHFEHNKGILYAVLGLLSYYVKILAATFSISAFEHYPIILQGILFGNIIGFLPPPLCILYFQGIIHKSNKLKPIYLLLFVPFLLAIVNFIPFFELPLSEKIQLYKNSASALNDPGYLWTSWSTSTMISDVYNSILGCIMILFLFRQLVQKEDLLNKKSHSSLIQIGLILIINFFVLLILAFPKIYNIKEHLNSENLEMISLIFPVSIMLFPNYIYDIYTHSDLSFYLRLMTRFTRKEKEETDSNSQELIFVASRILHFLNQKKPYLSPRFSKHDIVTHLNIPQKTVTDCFIKVIKIPFPQMRNQLRIEYAIDLFKNGAHLKNSISGIATDAGFKNRATFYIAFKEITKMTPVEWINENCDAQKQVNFVDEPSENEVIKIKADQKQTYNFKDEG
jgi:AraC-like DNA-binding protein